MKACETLFYMIYVKLTLEVSIIYLLIHRSSFCLSRWHGKK